LLVISTDSYYDARIHEYETYEYLCTMDIAASDTIFITTDVKLLLATVHLTLTHGNSEY